jgi:hypothetical protein
MDSCELGPRVTPAWILLLDDSEHEPRTDTEEDTAMKRMLSAAVVMLAALALVGEGLAQPMGGGPGHGWMGQGMGPGMMSGGGPRGMMGGPGGAGTCPRWTGAAAATEPEGVTEEKARELAQEYADRYLKGFTVERVLPFTGRRGTMYSVELKGPEGQVRTFHVNPWGSVMPFGGPGRRAG